MTCGLIRNTTSKFVGAGESQEKCHANRCLYQYPKQAPPECT